MQLFFDDKGSGKRKKMFGEVNTASFTTTSGHSTMRVAKKLKRLDGINNLFSNYSTAISSRLPEKAYIGDGINIFVDEEFREKVFPRSTQLVSQYLALAEEA